jgi:hypothetical protein
MMRIFGPKICDVRNGYEKLKSEPSELSSSKSDKDVKLRKTKWQKYWSCTGETQNT